jgi:hypothetical protein
MRRRHSRHSRRTLPRRSCRWCCWRSRCSWPGDRPCRWRWPGSTRSGTPGSLRQWPPCTGGSPRCSSCRRGSHPWSGTGPWGRTWPGPPSCRCWWRRSACSRRRCKSCLRSSRSCSSRRRPRRCWSRSGRSLGCTGSTRRSLDGRRSSPGYRLCRLPG